MALLRDPVRRAQVRRDIAEDRLPGAGYTGLVRHGRFDRIVILHAARHPELRGRSVADIAAARGADAFDTFLDLIVEEDDGIVGIFDYIDEADIRALLTSPAGDGLFGRARDAACRRRSTTRRCTGPAATASTRASSSATCATSRSSASRRPCAR